MRLVHATFLALLLASALAPVAVDTAAQQLPKPTGAINDFADVLSASEVQTLTALAEDVERTTSAEIAVATVTSLDGLTVEEYATALFAAWGVGQAGKDNGVLIVVAPAEREMRIEVGYGLEGVLPDGLAGQIIRETFLPAFRDNAFGRGIVDGTTRIAGIVRRNQPLTDAELQALAASQDPASSNDAMLPYVLVPFLGLFVSIGFGMAGAGVGARAVGPIFFGAVFGGIPMALGATVGMPRGAWVLAGIAALALVIGFRLGRRPGSRASMRGSSKKAGDRWVWGMGGPSSGRSSSGRSSSGSSSGSSSSFGGGRSGGGGASGRW
jgi:uncharacterized protein